MIGGMHEDGDGPADGVMGFPIFNALYEGAGLIIGCFEPRFEVVPFRRGYCAHTLPDLAPILVANFLPGDHLSQNIQ